MGILSYVKRWLFGMVWFYIGIIVILLLIGGAVSVLPMDFSPDPIEESDVESEIVEQVNEARSSNGAIAVSRENGLQQQAEFHSSEMAEHEELSHQIGTSTAESRLQDADCGYGSENLAQGEVRETVEIDGETYHTDDAESLAEAIVVGWKNSEGHFENMVNPDWRDTGVSVWISEDGTVYATQMFCE